MNTITDVANECQLLLTEEADELARECGFVRRERKLTGSRFVQALALTWAHKAQATLGDVVENLEDHGVILTEEAIRKRFNAQGAAFLRAMVERALTRVLEGRRETIPLLRRFNGVYLDDCSSVTLPADLADVFAGCGGSDAEAGRAGVKMFVRLEVSSGAVDQVSFSAGRSHKRMQVSAVALGCLIGSSAPARRGSPRAIAASEAALSFLRKSRRLVA